MTAPKHRCEPTVYTVGGADHTGLDAYLRCPVCLKTTTHHVECHRVTPEVERMLRLEWSNGRVAP